MTDFRLQPFNQDDDWAIEITGKIVRSGKLLSIGYQLSGDIQSVEIVSLAPTPERKFHLWEATCFEFFVGIPGTKNYWEFNLAPSGDWNVFHLDDYRQGLRDELAFRALPFILKQQEDLFSLALEFDLTKIIAVEQQIEVSITTVIKSTQANISYLALTHCAAEADFHQRDSFTLKL